MVRDRRGTPGLAMGLMTVVLLLASDDDDDDDINGCDDDGVLLGDMISLLEMNWEHLRTALGICNI